MIAWFWNTFENLYVRIMKEKPGKRTREFLKNLMFVYGGTAIAGIFGLISMLVVARVIGPSEYGKFNVMLAVAGFMIVPMIWGFTTAAAKYLSSAKQKAKWMSTTIALVVSGIIIFAIVYHFFSSGLASLFKTDEILLRIAILFAIILSLYYLAEALLRGLFAMSRLGFARALAAAFSLSITLILLFVLKRTGFQVPVLAGMAGFIVFILIALPRLKFSFKDVSKKYAKQLTIYGSFIAIGFVSGTALGFVDRLMINHFMSIDQVGIYSAYQIATVFLAEKLLAPFVLVFFSTAAAYKHKAVLWEKLRRISSWCFMAILGVTIAAVTVSFWILGEQYQLVSAYVGVFCVVAALQFVTSMRWWFIAATGTKGVKWASIAGVTAAIVNIIANYVLIQKYGLIGSAIALALAVLVLFVLSFKAIQSVHLES